MNGCPIFLQAGSLRARRQSNEQAIFHGRDRAVKRRMAYTCHRSLGRRAFSCATPNAGQILRCQTSFTSEITMRIPEIPNNKYPPADIEDRINAFCKKHGISLNKFFVMARVSPNVLRMIKRHRKFRPQTLAKIEKALAGEESRPPPVIKFMQPMRRHPCPKCNVRGDIGCAHQKPGEGRSIYDA